MIIDGVLNIEKPIIGISEIMKEFNNTKELFHSINVHSYCIYFDEDAKFTGTNLCIQSRYAHISKDIKVDLKGEEGQLINIEQAQNGIEDGTNGQDGIPGYPGKAGGNFYLKSSQCTTKGLLQIDVSGGNGSKGQNGGNGRKGRDGAKSSLAKIYQRDQECLVQRIPIKFSDKDAKGKTMHALKSISTANNQMLEIYKCGGQPGQKGGDGGSGGQGGIGGYSGTISIDCPGIDRKDTTGQGEDGCNGKHGIPGQGGVQGNA